MRGHWNFGEENLGLGKLDTRLQRGVKPQKPGIQTDLPIPMVFIIQDRTMPMN